MAPPGARDAPAADAREALADASDACDDPADCASGLCVDHVCQVTSVVPCADVAPPHATSMVVDVVISYAPDTGWSEPAACAWVCDVGYCASGAGCAANLADLGYAPASAGSKWFGGDDRDLDGDGAANIRSVGGGESFVVDTPRELRSVGFWFTAPFASATTGVAHDTQVTVDLRTAPGTVIGSATVVVPATFAGGWVDWPMPVFIVPGTYILTAYAPQVFAGENYTTGIRTDFAGQYAGGATYEKELESPGQMQDWVGWAGFTDFDVAFRVTMACR